MLPYKTNYSLIFGMVGDAPYSRALLGGFTHARVAMATYTPNAKCQQVLYTRSMAG